MDDPRGTVVIDADSRTYQALGVGRLSRLGLLSPAGLRRYASAMRSGARQGKMTGDIRQLPGVAILDASARAIWVHPGETIGDYPPIADVLQKLESLA